MSLFDEMDAWKARQARFAPTQYISGNPLQNGGQFNAKNSGLFTQKIQSPSPILANSANSPHSSLLFGKLSQRSYQSRHTPGKNH